MSKKKQRKKQRAKQAAAAAQAHSGFDLSQLSQSTLVRGLIVVQVLFFMWQFTPALSTNGDNAKYYALGESLAEGEGYRAVYRPGEPKETTYPIVFPAMLAALRVFSSTPLMPKTVVAFTGILVTLLCYYFFRRYITRRLLVFLLLVATSGYLAQYSVILMSEIPYLFFTLAALVLLDKSTEEPKNRVLFWITIVVSVLPMNTRSIGLSFTVAWIVGNLLAKRYRYAAAHAVLILAVAIAFRSLTSWDNPYFLQLFQKNSYDPELGYVSVGEMLQRIGNNIAKLGFVVVRNTMAPFGRSFPPFLGALLAKIMVALIFVGWIRGLGGRLRIVSLYVFFYLGVVCMWQTQWVSERFVVSIVPFLYLLMLMGLETLLTLFNPERPRRGAELVESLKNVAGWELSPNRRRTLWALAAIVVVLNIHFQFANRGVGKQIGKDWRHFYSCADWVRLNAPKDAVVVSRSPGLFFVRSERQGLVYPYSHDVEKIVEFFKEKNVTHVVFDNFRWTRTTAKYLYPVLTSHPELFKTVYGLKNPDTFVLEFVR